MGASLAADDPARGHSQRRILPAAEDPPRSSRVKSTGTTIRKMVRGFLAHQDHPAARRCMAGAGRGSAVHYHALLQAAVALFLFALVCTDLQEQGYRSVDHGCKHDLQPSTSPGSYRSSDGEPSVARDEESRFALNHNHLLDDVDRRAAVPADHYGGSTSTTALLGRAGAPRTFQSASSICTSLLPSFAGAHGAGLGGAGGSSSQLVGHRIASEHLAGTWAENLLYVQWAGDFAQMNLPGMPNEDAKRLVKLLKSLGAGGASSSKKKSKKAKPFHGEKRLGVLLRQAEETRRQAVEKQQKARGGGGGGQKSAAQSGQQHSQSSASAGGAPAAGGGGGSTSSPGAGGTE